MFIAVKGIEIYMTNAISGWLNDFIREDEDGKPRIYRKYFVNPIQITTISIHKEPTEGKGKGREYILFDTVSSRDHQVLANPALKKLLKDKY